MCLMTSQFTLVQKLGLYHKLWDGSTFTVSGDDDLNFIKTTSAQLTKIPEFEWEKETQER